jgi:endonuclease III
MKDSREYSKKIQRLYRSLKRKHPKPHKVAYENIVDGLVYAILSEDISEAAAQAAIKRFASYFIDWNDLRVSRVEEIVEVLGEDTPITRGIASALTRVLRAIFEKYNMVSLEALKKIGKRPAKQVLEKMIGTTNSHFVVDYCMLTALHGHAIPLTKKMTEYLRDNELVHPEADEQVIEGFLARQIPTKGAYDFYYLLRCQSESRRSGASKKKKISEGAETEMKTKTKRENSETQ